MTNRPIEDFKIIAFSGNADPADIFHALRYVRDVRSYRLGRIGITTFIDVI